MKRILLLAACAAILCALMAGASAEALTVAFETPYYTMMLPEGWEIYEPDTADDTDTFISLGNFSSPEDRFIWAECYLNYLEDWKDTSLWNATDEELEEYIDVTLKDFEADNPQYLGIVEAGRIPFVLFKGTDQYGEYLYVDTMTNGCAVLFYIYRSELGTDASFPLSDEDVETLTKIFESFKPKVG